MITVYSIIIRSAIVENDFAINRNRMSSFKVVIFVVRKLTFYQTITFMKVTFFARETSSRKIIILVRSSIFIKETSFIEISRIVIMNEYRSSHINIKDVIVFAFLKMKKAYNARYQFIFFKIRDFINLRFYKDYKVSVIISKKIRS